MPAMTVKELERFLLAEFPQVFHSDSGLAIEAVWDGGCRVRQAFRQVSVRPGGTISGPTMMALADFAMYVAVLAAFGPVRGCSNSANDSRWARSPSARMARESLSPT
jgi:acyl-coenzyme A thioesterase PaaI-like protein